MRRLLNQAANAAVKRKGRIFGMVYRRLVPRLGHNKTIGASFLCTSIPAILYGIGFLLAGAESVPKITLSRVSSYRRSHKGRDNAHLFALTHAPDQTGVRSQRLH
jgi:hypothetical protein